VITFLACQSTSCTPPY